MDCQNYKEQISLYLSNSLDQAQRIELEKHLAKCSECNEEYLISKRIWDLMGVSPEPIVPENMKPGFQAILTNFKKEQSKESFSYVSLVLKIRQQWNLQVQPRLAFGIVMVLMGLAGGYFLGKPSLSQKSDNHQIDSLTAQVTEMKQVMMLTLLHDPSASQRMLAVGYTDEMDKVNNKVIDALLTTLNEDPNVNVRLITLEALIKYANQPRVREGLIQSLARQDSPLLQSAIADVMVKLQEKKSVRLLQDLLRKKDLNEMVKVKVEQSIQKLI